MKKAGSLGKLVFSVPASNDVLHAGIECALGETNEEAEDVELIDVCTFDHEDC